MGGGGLDFGLNAKECVRKEILEEFGCDVLEIEFMGYRDVHRKSENGEDTHWVALDFKCQVDPLKVVNNEPHKFDELGWFKLGDFPKPWHSQFPAALAAYKDVL